MKLLSEKMLSKLVYQFKTLKYKCLPLNLAFSDEFLNLNEKENRALESVINGLIEKKLLFRKDITLCLTEEGKKWIRSLDYETSDEKESEKKEIPPYDLMRILVSFYKLDKINLTKPPRKRL